MSPTLTDIPNEVVLDHLLPALLLKDVAALSAVNRQFNILTSDPTFWRNKTLQDFTFPSTSHPSLSTSKGWWKRVYLGLLNPKAYLWGSSDNNRLGGAEESSSRKYARYVDIPSEIQIKKGEVIEGEKSKNWSEHLKDSLVTALSSRNTPEIGDIAKEPGVRNGSGIKSGIVELQAGGWSFTARQSDGSVWVWGQLDGLRPGFRLHSWEDKHCPVPQPTKLPLPCKAESISAGRNHLLILDSDNLIWELRAWGKAYYHTASELTAPSGHGITKSPPHIVQLSTGWQHSAALTSKGEIHIWYPFSESYQDALTSDSDLSGPLSGTDEDVKERGLKYGKVGNDVVTTLPPIPSRADLGPPSRLPDTDTASLEDIFKVQRREKLEDEWKEYASTRSPKIIADEQRVIKIASGEDFVVALKKNGEVWLSRIKEREVPYWQYMEYFSSPTITHITAQFRSFTTYATPTTTSSTSAVYHVRLPDYSENLGVTTIPERLESLQNKGIIQVAIGDYHYAALTDKGEMLTWGQGDSGQLGRGKNKSGKEPIKVIFPEDEYEDEEMTQEEQGENVNKGSFVFSITAGGWHTGALVLGDPKGRKRTNRPQKRKEVANDQEENAEEAESRWPRSLFNPFNGNTNNSTVPVPTIIRGGEQPRGIPLFRVGFAGRGANVGAGRGNHAQGSTQDQGQAENNGQGGMRGGAPIFRVGFAGRGGNTAAGRGRGGSNAGEHDDDNDSRAPW